MVFIISGAQCLTFKKRADLACYRLLYQEFELFMSTFSNFRSYHPIFKILFLFEKYDIKDLTFIIFVRLSIRLSVRSVLPFQFPFRTTFSNSVLTVRFPKFFFLFERYITSDTFLYTLCPSVKYLQASSSIALSKIRNL